MNSKEQCRVMAFVRFPIACKFAGHSGIASLLRTVLMAGVVVLAAPARGQESSPEREVRGTWLTTTANDAIATPQKTAETMRRLREIGTNTIYVECWKNGYTQFPSKVLQRTIGVDRRPALMKQDPSDDASRAKAEGRDLLGETLLAAHCNGLIYVAWFEYGFMAAHSSTDNHLRRMKPEWMSKDINGNTVAPNGFVWMNPLHPECRRFLTDLVLEAIDRYDLDGVQLDDRIVWPHITMGYDEYTRGVYVSEHAGKQPPEDCHDAEWTRWRADKVNQYAEQFVKEVRAKRPGLIISLSPAPYPWVYENYCLEWPKWAAWPRTGGGWDEFIPQNYRFTYQAFEKTWTEQMEHWTTLAGGRSAADLIPGIRIVGDGEDSSWEQLRDSILLSRKNGNAGHVLWFSRGVLDVYPKELAEFYDVNNRGYATNPHFPRDWRPGLVELVADDADKAAQQEATYTLSRGVPPGEYIQVREANGVWTPTSDTPTKLRVDGRAGERVPVTGNAKHVYILIDRRADMSGPRPPSKAPFPQSPAESTK